MLIEYLGRISAGTHVTQLHKGKQGAVLRWGKKKKSPGESAFPDGDCKVLFLMLSKRFSENTISQVHYFLFESICLPCLLLSDKGGENLAIYRESKSRLAFIYTFALKHTLSSESIGSLNEA